MEKYLKIKFKNIQDLSENIKLLRDEYTVVKRLILPKLTNTLNSLSVEKQQRFLEAR